LLSAASSSGNIHKPTKSQRPQTTCLPPLQFPAQAPPLLLHTAKTAFDLAVPRGMPRAGHSHTGMALCAVLAECCLLLWKSPRTGKTAAPTNHLHSPAAAPSAGSTIPAAHYRETSFDLAVPHGMPRAGLSYTGMALCAVVAECCLLLWKSPQTTGKTATPPTNHLHSAAAAPSAGPVTPAAHCTGCI